MSRLISGELESAFEKDVMIDISASLSQATPFWKGEAFQPPPRLVKPSNFDQQWAAVLDERGSYLDDQGRRVAVQRRLDDGNLSGVNDIHWAAYNTARHWVMLGVVKAKSAVGEQPSIMWRRIIREMRNSCKEEIRELAVQEMARMKIQSDTRINVLLPPEPYAYPALLPDPSAIRLVVLLPSLEAHSDIICRLCNSTLSKSEIDQYEALSYVWGDPTKRKAITVENRRFQATENLESALRHLRYQDKPRVLWIDAICINQNDVVERSSQVQQMDLIYKNSQSVVVWLGPESEDSSDALEFISILASYQIPTDGQLYREFLKTISYCVAALEHLLGRPWFTRIWCIQEFILGPNAILQCGRYNISWEDFEPFLRQFADVACNGMLKNEISSAGISIGFFQRLLNFSKLLSRKRAQTSYESALSLICDFQGWQSSDPRDFVFALYSLLPNRDPDKDILKPDYKLTVSEVYTNLAIHFLQKYRDLSILYIATWPVKGFRDISQVHRLPCWVPDWRHSQQHDLEHYYKPISYEARDINPFECFYDASFGLAATPVDLEDDDQVLCLDGIEIDIIADISDVHMNPVSDLYKPDHHQILSKWKKIARLSNKLIYRYTGQPACEAFWRTVLLDSQEGIVHEDMELTGKSRIPAWGFESTWFGDYHLSDGEDYNFLRRTITNRTVCGRKFFTTSRGMFGLGPATAKEGDYVVVLFGGKVPFVLRDIKDLQLHQLIGECYVHGIMDGEMIHQPRTEEFQNLHVERFRLA